MISFNTIFNMKHKAYHFSQIAIAVLLLGSVISCTGDSPSGNSSTKEIGGTAATDTTQVSNTTNSKTPQAIRIPEKHDCVISGTVLDDNSFWIKDAQVLVGISADPSTKDVDFGDSHRKFTALNTANCNIILTETLPVNKSPDFPWYLNTNTYESVNKVLCMQGVEFVYCYDVAEGKMLPQMKPAFYNKRNAVDAQSGNPAGLTVWGNYLIGYSLDQGASVFDLANKENPAAVLPVAEFYSKNDESYHSLFLLSDGGGQIQAMIPGLNEDQDGMEANPLFSKTLALNTSISKSAKNNRFIVLSSRDEKSKVAIDMEKRKTVDLPIEINDKTSKEVLDWLKKNT
jgi:hypothetical protein